MPPHRPSLLVWAALSALGAVAAALPAHAQAPVQAARAFANSQADSQSGEAADAAQLEEVSIVGTFDDLQSLDFLAPNSSAVIDRQTVREQGARKLDQALHYQAGLLAEPFGADNKVEWFKIRGFDASVSLDGTPTTPNGYFVWKPELFGVESVEILKGPNSLVFGPSESGGVVNLITKRPHKLEALELGAELGNRDRLGLSVDYNGIANADGSVYYRLVAQARREDGMQRRTDMKSYYFAPSATIEFSPDTSLTLLASIQHEDGRPTNGFLPAYGTVIDTPYGRIDPRTNAGEPDFDRLKRTQASAGWLLSHKLGNDWTFSQNYRYSRLNIDQRNVFAYNSDGDRQLLRGYTFTDGNTKNHYIDNRLSGSLRLAEDVLLRPTFGIDYLKSDTTGLNNGFGQAPNLDMFNPVYGAPFAVQASPYTLHSRQWGAYASAQLQAGSHWRFNAGMRHDRTRNRGEISGADAGYEVSHNTFNAGAMYVSDYGIAPYVGYSESFKPLSGVDANGSRYKPYEGRQGEIGVKLMPQWLDGTVTLAYFDVQEKNALIADASNIQTQSGKRTNKGFELQGDFNLSANTALKVAYTRNRSRQDVSDTKTVRTPLLPNHQASLWASHRLQLPGQQDLTVAAGLRYNGATTDENNYPGITIASHTLVDLMVRYTLTRDWALQLNARNLTDKRYVSGCDFYCYYGGGRTVDVQLQYQW